jgi:hypothetical protein
VILQTVFGASYTCTYQIVWVTLWVSRIKGSNMVVFVLFFSSCLKLCGQDEGVDWSKMHDIALCLLQIDWMILARAMRTTPYTVTRDLYTRCFGGIAQQREYNTMKHPGSLFNHQHPGPQSRWRSPSSWCRSCLSGAPTRPRSLELGLMVFVAQSP